MNVLALDLSVHIPKLTASSIYSYEQHGQAEVFSVSWVQVGVGYVRGCDVTRINYHHAGNWLMAPDWSVQKHIRYVHDTIPFLMFSKPHPSILAREDLAC